MQELFPFASTYLCSCESDFSPFVQTKNKYRARLDATSDIRSAIKSNFSELLQSRKQIHSSH